MTNPGYEATIVCQRCGQTLDRQSYFAKHLPFCPEPLTNGLVETREPYFVGYMTAECFNPRIITIEAAPPPFPDQIVVKVMLYIVGEEMPPPADTGGG